MAPHSSALAWKIPWMEESSGLQPMGPQRVGPDCATEHMYYTGTCCSLAVNGRRDSLTFRRHKDVSPRSFMPNVWFFVSVDNCVSTFSV